MFKAEVQTGWLTQAPAEGLWEFSLQPEPGFIYTYHSASLHTSRTQKCTTTADTYRTRTINILLSRSGAYSWLQEGSILDSPATSKKKIHGQRRCFQGHAEAINSNLIIVTPLDCKIRAVNTNYRHFKLRHPKNKDFLKEKMCFFGTSGTDKDEIWACLSGCTALQASVLNTQVFAGSTTEGRCRRLTAKSNTTYMKIEKKLHFQNHHTRDKQVIWGEMK